MLETAVALFIFNRPQLTSRVFAEIASARPRRLLIVADGPRFDDEREKCEAARATVSQVNWQCDVLKNFSDVNLGCKGRISSGLDWVFSQCEEAIILEDDCLPHPSFFRYCEEVLRWYRDDERVMMVSGDNFQLGRARTPYSYYLSRYCHVWGWASWRRAWRYYDVEMKLWPELRQTRWLRDVLGDGDAAACWQDAFDGAFAGEIDTWDYQWLFACWAQNGLVILPAVNLVSNIGFGSDATHGNSGRGFTANLPTSEMIFPLRHPPYVIRNGEGDQFTWERVFRRSRPADYRRRLARIVPQPIRKLMFYVEAQFIRRKEVQ